MHSHVPQPLVRRAALCLVVALFSVLALGARAPAGAPDDIVLTFDPLDSIVFGFGTVAVQASIDAGTDDLRGFSFTFTYDPSLVDFVSFTPGALLAGCGNNFLFRLNPVAGVVEMDGAGLDCSMAGPGSIVEFVFQGKNTPGITPLKIDCPGVRMRDAENNPHNVDCVDGSIRVVVPITVQPDSWGSLKARYR